MPAESRNEQLQGWQFCFHLRREANRTAVSLLSSNEDEFLIEHWRVGLRGYQRFANRGKA